MCDILDSWQRYSGCEYAYGKLMNPYIIRVNYQRIQIRVKKNNK